MRKFEVKIVTVNMPGTLWNVLDRARVVAEPLSSSLTKLGEEGWELVSVVPFRGVLQHYFKREVKTE